VFCVTSFGEDIAEAVNTSLDVLEYVRFGEMYYRTDIGYEFRPAYNTPEDDD